MEDLTELRARGAVMVDVRTPEEFAGGCAPGCLNIPLDQLAQRMGELDMARPILLCCASGARSGYAQRFLQQAGFRDVHNAGPWQRLR